MGKYFSADSDLTKFNVDSTETTNKSAIPSTDNLTAKPLSNNDKERLGYQAFETPINTDDHIDMVRVQADHTTEMVNKYSRDTKKAIEQQFEKFAPAELFEKLNQIIFTMADLSNRIATLEKVIVENLKDGKLPERKQPIEITDPEQLYRLQKKMDTISDVNPPETIPDNKPSEPMDIETLKSRLMDAKTGKTKKIPSEGLAGEGIKLEEVFPDLDDAAYTAAYSAMNRYGKPTHTTEKAPEPGSLRNLSGL